MKKSMGKRKKQCKIRRTRQAQLGMGAKGIVNPIDHGDAEVQD